MKAEQEILWRSYRAALHRFILQRVHNEAAAEDIVQNVLIKAYSGLVGLKRPAKLRAWLYRITRHAIIDYYRQSKPWSPFSDELNSEAILSAEPDATAEQELSACIRPLLQNLPELYRQALELCDLQGLKQRDLAARLGLSLSGAKSRVQRARQMLREQLVLCCQIEWQQRAGIVDYQLQRPCMDCGDSS